MSAPTPRILPASPNLEHLRKQARDLQRDHQAGRAEAFARVRSHLPRLADSSISEIAAARLSRTDAQLVVAREYGFPSWPRLVATLGAPADRISRLKAAIEQGESDTILQMLEDHPGLREQPFEWQDAKGRRRRITPMRFANACNQQASVDALLEAGADLGFLGTALWNNVYNRNLPQVRRLLARGVDPNAGFSLACGLIGPARHEFVNLLIETGASFSDDARMDIHRNELTALGIRLRRDPALIHQHFVDTSQGMPTGGTLLHIAAAHNDLTVIDLLAVPTSTPSARCTTT